MVKRNVSSVWGFVDENAVLHIRALQAGGVRYGISFEKPLSILFYLCLIVM